MKRNVQLVIIPDEWREKFLARMETWEAETSQEKQAAIDQLRAELGEVKARIERINNGFADRSLDVHEFKELKNPLVPRKTGLEQKPLRWSEAKPIGSNP